MNSDPDNYQIKLLAMRPIAQDTLEFEFSRPQGFDFTAGQFVNMCLPWLAARGEPDNERMFSIASAPADPYLLFAMRMRDTAFKRALSSLQVGEQVEISPAMGEFVLEKKTLKPLVFIAGGIGITPFYSMLRDLLENLDARPITLLYANREPSLVAWADELLDLTRKGIKLIHLLERDLDAMPTSASCQVRGGRVSNELIGGLLHEYPNAAFYIVGPDPMVESVTGLIRSAGVADERLFFESFWGY